MRSQAALQRVELQNAHVETVRQRAFKIFYFEGGVTICIGVRNQKFFNKFLGFPELSEQLDYRSKTWKVVGL